MRCRMARQRGAPHSNCNCQAPLTALTGAPFELALLLVQSHSCLDNTPSPRALIVITHCNHCQIPGLPCRRCRLVSWAPAAMKARVAALAACMLLTGAARSAAQGGSRLVSFLPLAAPTRSRRPCTCPRAPSAAPIAHFPCRLTQYHCHQAAGQRGGAARCRGPANPVPPPRFPGAWSAAGALCDHVPPCG